MGKGTKRGEGPTANRKRQRRVCEADKLASIDFREIQARSYATVHPEINLSISMHAELEWGRPFSTSSLLRVLTPASERALPRGVQGGRIALLLSTPSMSTHPVSPLALRHVDSLEQATLFFLSFFGSRALSLWFCHLR